MKDSSERPYSEFAEYCAVCGEHDHEENAHLDKTPRRPFVGTEHAGKRIAELKRWDQDLRRDELLAAALDLVVELWPKPGNATIHLESHQWVRLREVLLAIPELRARNDTDSGS